MQIQIFNVPIHDCEECVVEMNKFLRGHRVVTIDKQFCLLGDNAVWSFCVTYVEGTIPDSSRNTESREKVDYRKILDADTFDIFSRLRDIRKAMAIKNGLPAYMIFTDAELAEISKLPAIDIAAIEGLKGVGVTRAKKYGEELCRQLSEGNEQTDL